MAAGWPTKVTYANGDVFSASDINDTNGTLNYVNPTSATDKQVLTRDAASGGKVKWADSPANTLTTTGDLYYASAANTPARLAIGTTGKVLTVAGGVPTWAAGSSTFTKIGSTVTFSNVASQAFDDVFTSTYKSYFINIETLYAATSGNNLRFQYRYAGPTTHSTRYYGNSFAMPYTGANSSTQASNASSAALAAIIGGSSPNINGGYLYVYGAGISSDVTLTGAYTTSGNSVGYVFNYHVSGDTTRTYTGFLLSSSSTNITGSVSVYGVS